MDEEVPAKTPRLAYKRTPLVGLGISAFGLLILMVSQNPGQGGPVVVMPFLALLFTAYLCLISLLLQFISSIFSSIEFSWARLLYTSVAMAGGMVFLTGLQTLRQLQLIDVILVLVFELMLNFYLLRRF